MNINEGVNQEGLKEMAGIVKKTSRSGGMNYAAVVNERAKQRMEQLRRNIEAMDLIQAVSRIKIDNLPRGLRSKQMQRILYYQGNAVFFYEEKLEKYLFLPYGMTSSKDKSIDFYGQYQLIKPMTFNGKSTESSDNKKKKASDVYLGVLDREPVYDMEELEEMIKMRGEEECRRRLCIIFRDYTQLRSENNVPRATLQEVFIQMQAEVLPMIRTVMLKAAMPKLVRAGDEGVVDSLIAELQAIEDSIISGKTMIPVTAFQDLQEIGSADTGRVIEMMAKMYETHDNIRKGFLGVPNDGAFKKNAHMLQDEQDTNGASSNSILDDCLDNYKSSFDMVNRLFGLDIQVSISEAMQLQQQSADEKDADAPGADVPDAGAGDQGGEAL